MFKVLEIMKTLRYLLISFAVMMVMSVGAQGLAQEPTTEFHSTSSMVGSGSTLPMAVESGAYTTYDVNNDAGQGVIRKIGGGNSGGGDPGPTDPDDPYATPIWDGIGALALLACAYALLRYVRMRKRAKQMM